MWKCFFKTLFQISFSKNKFQDFKIEGENVLSRKKVENNKSISFKFFFPWNAFEEKQDNNLVFSRGKLKNPAMRTASSHQDIEVKGDLHLYVWSGPNIKLHSVEHLVQVRSNIQSILSNDSSKPVTSRLSC